MFVSFQCDSDKWLRVPLDTATTFRHVYVSLRLGAFHAFVERGRGTYPDYKVTWKAGARRLR